MCGTREPATVPGRRRGRAATPWPRTGRSVCRPLPGRAPCASRWRWGDPQKGPWPHPTWRSRSPLPAPRLTAPPQARRRPGHGPGRALTSAPGSSEARSLPVRVSAIAAAHRHRALRRQAGPHRRHRHATSEGSASPRPRRCTASTAGMSKANPGCHLRVSGGTAASGTGCPLRRLSRTGPSPAQASLVARS